MRSLKSGLLAIALSGLCGTVAVIGCSADGAGGIDTEAAPTEQATPKPATQPAAKPAAPPAPAPKK